MRRAMLATALALGALASSAQAQVIANGLARPRGLALAPDGTLYATVLGGGGPSCNGEGCFGASGRVVAFRATGLQTFASGLLTMRGSADGFFSIGADQLTPLADGRLATVITAEFNGMHGTIPRAVPAALRGQVGHVVYIARDGSKQIGANVAAVEYAQNPDGAGVVSNPYGIAELNLKLYVSDSAANDLLEVDGDSVRVLTVFPDAGKDSESVPDALTAGPDGALYVGEFTGGPHKAGSARIWRVVPGQPPSVFATGLTGITALAFGPDGSLYAAEFDKGDVVRIRPDRTRSVLGAGQLHYPGGIVVSGDSLFVTNWTVASSKPARKGELKGHTGQIVRLEVPA